MLASKFCPSPRIRASSLVAALTLVALTIVDATSRDARGEDTPVEPVSTLPLVSGDGESLVIVTGGIFDTREQALAAAKKTAVGDMQGFYVDTTDNYTVKGVYPQATRETFRIRCGDNLVDSVTQLADVGVITTPFQVQRLCDKSDTAVSEVYETLDFTVPVQLGVKAPVLEMTTWTWSVPNCMAPTADTPECMQQSVAFSLTGTALPPGKYLLLSGFRTKFGAEQFMDFMRSADFRVSALQVSKRGSQYVGLGQEPHPDGSGPLQVELPSQETYQ